MATAAAWVLAIPEFLELILLNLKTEEDLINAYSVNDFWHNCIEGSPKLSRKLFLRAEKCTEEDPHFQRMPGPPSAAGFHYNVSGPSQDGHQQLRKLYTMKQGLRKNYETRKTTYPNEAWLTAFQSDNHLALVRRRIALHATMPDDFTGTFAAACPGCLNFHELIHQDHLNRFLRDKQETPNHCWIGFGSHIVLHVGLGRPQVDRTAKKIEQRKDLDGLRHLVTLLQKIKGEGPILMHQQVSRPACTRVEVACMRYDSRTSVENEEGVTMEELYLSLVKLYEAEAKRLDGMNKHDKWFRNLRQNGW